MGISASQARLLTITARLSSNEYESQQISNAKMRLATQSEQASRDYIAALDTKRLQFMTYDAQGSAVTEDLTANAIYQYVDMKNQYMLVNSSGQAIVSSADAKNFKNSGNLDEFLENYGIKKVYKTSTLAENAEKLSSEEYQNYYDTWEQAVNAAKTTTYERGGEEVSSDKAYEIDRYNAKNAYDTALENYQKELIKHSSGLPSEVGKHIDILAEAKQKYADTITYQAWAEAQAAYETALDADGNEIMVFTEVYENIQQYYEVLGEFLAEAEDIGCTTVEDAYEYSDASKAQWYTNLWYRMNGESSFKSALGENATNYSILDSRLASSNQWLQDALSQGIISIEIASNENISNILDHEYISSTFATKSALHNVIQNPLNMTLRGITWKTTEYGNCSEFVEKDDDIAVARAEAEYERKNNEIAAKDKKYENKIKTLDTEHNTLQTEYDSVQSAMNKNIDRSYKTFNG